MNVNLKAKINYVEFQMLLSKMGSDMIEKLLTGTLNFNTKIKQNLRWVPNMPFPLVNIAFHSLLYSKTIRQDSVTGIGSDRIGQASSISR